MEWQVVQINEEAETQYKDVISESELLESFKTSVTNEYSKNGYVDLADMDDYVKKYEESALLGNPITKEIRKTRLNRLVEILTAERELDDTLSFIAEEMGHSLSDLIIRYKDEPNINGLIESIIEQRPDFLEQMQSSRIIQERMDKLNQEITELHSEKSSLENNIKHIRENPDLQQKSALETKTKELAEIESRCAEAESALEETAARLGLSTVIQDLQAKQVEMENIVQRANDHRRLLESQNNSLEASFSSFFSNQHNRMVDIVFDGFISNKMLEAASEWETERNEKKYIESINAINSISTSEKNPEELITHLCSLIKIERPQYTKNTIINLAICITQGFLTVLSGEPGCGKTSICNIIGNVLGLNKIKELVDEQPDLIENITRYIPVSVERGWTSKRDFIGYFNPLSKSFDKSDSRIYDGLKILDLECKSKSSNYPFLILLDEANLSSMEYYWADFMNICDDIDSNSRINLGENHHFLVPDTLRFVATINNDHTTETLSPRLLDRAWIISLPQFSSIKTGSRIPNEKLELISWSSIRKTFMPSNSQPTITGEAQQIFETKLFPLFRKAHIAISPRAELAIKSYWAVASKLFEKDEYGSDPSIVALDYAISQKILPHINGNGEDYAQCLEELKTICKKSNLSKSADSIASILDKGNIQMKYYQYFS